MVRGLRIGDGSVEDPEWAAVIADAATFMDLDTVVAAWGHEYRIIEPT